MDDATRARLAGKSGDAGMGKFPKFVVPAVRFDGNTGEFRKITKVEGKDDIIEPIKGPVRFVTLKKRSTLGTKLNVEPSLFTSEFSSPFDSVSLFQNIGGKVTFLKNGKPSDLRMENPNLKTAQIVYFLMDGEIMHTVIRGDSVGNYFDFQTKMNDEGKHSFEYVTVVDKEKKRNDKARKDYYAMTFDSAPLDIDSELLEEKMDIVNDAIQKMDDYQKQRAAQAPSAPVATPTSGLEDTFNNKQDINPDDIPF